MKTELEQPSTCLISLVVKSAPGVISQLNGSFNFLYIISTGRDLLPTDLCVLLHANFQTATPRLADMNKINETVNQYINSIKQLDICKIEISEHEYFLEKLSGKVKEYDEIIDDGDIPYFKFGELCFVGKCIVFDNVEDLVEFLNKHDLTETLSRNDGGVGYYYTYTGIQWRATNKS